jgi:carboxylesterase type B
LLGPICEATFGPERTNTILSSAFYVPTLDAGGTIDIRNQLQIMGTDYLWRCSSWTFARLWVQNGGSAYVGLYTIGASYPGNEEVSFCSQPGSICHQDDIQLVFGTVSNPTPAQTSAINQIQQRYKAFLTNGNPNAPSLATWTAATPTDIHALNIGGSGEIDVGACVPSFWGDAVEYDFQFFSS